MGYVTSVKGQGVQLSVNFNSSEFDCHGKRCCSKTRINEKLVAYLQAIREHFNAPITITSGYRCPIHNSAVGGATRSKHAQGDAADIVVKGVSPREVAKYAESIGVLGIGLYETSKDGHFVHIDTRESRFFWYGKSEKAMKTFGGLSESATPNVTNTNSLNTILDRGDSGEAVKALQENLIKLGYSCGDKGADGIFGTKTEEAVKKFQHDFGLAEDGIAGHQTVSAIDKAVSDKSGTTESIVKSVRITANVLNVRSGAGLNYPVIANVRKGNVCKLIVEKNGWGMIQSPSGWISSKYYEHI